MSIVNINEGQRFRHQMYPDREGGGILRLHSTFRHDMKIKTSDEGRVMKTAATFAKGLLELEGEIPPILVSLIYKEKDSLHMLDPSGEIMIVVLIRLSIFIFLGIHIMLKITCVEILFCR